VRETAPEPVEATPAPETDKHATRRSTVREKVSFAANSTAEAAVPVAATEPAPAPDEPQAVAEPAAEAAPRRAGWWSRRFGNSQ
jgi:ribonuclease E